MRSGIETARLIRFIGAVLVVQSAPQGTVAQEIPKQLTLDEALVLARQWNPAYRRAVAQADARGADVRAARGQFLPDLSASLGFGADRRTVATGQDDYGGNVELDQSITLERSYSNQALSSQITVFNGLQNVNALRSAQAGDEAARWGVDAEEAALAAEVKRQFYAVVQWQELLSIEEELLAARVEELDATERLFRVAAREQVDVLGAQVGVARQEQRVESARGEVRKALLALSQVIGLDEGAEFEVVGDFPAVFDPALLDSEALVRQVLLSNPVLQQAEATASQADFAAQRARGLRWPTLSAGASFSRSVGQDGYGGLFELNPTDRAFAFSLSLSLPLFTRFSTSQSIAQADADRDAARESARETRLQLERDVRSSLIDCENTYRQLQLAERSAELGRQRLAMAQEQYQLGSRSFTELQQIVQTSADDARNALSARLNYVNAIIGLEQLVGRPVNPN